MQIVILILVIGFPIALAFSWAFEITPEGIVRESEVAADQSITHHTGRKIVALTIVLAVVATGLLLYRIVGTARWAVHSVETTEDGRRSAASLPVPNKSIAVLPFDNLSGDPQNAYFSEGVQDEILTRLAKIAELKVISRTSTQRFKSAPNDLRQIAQQLGVANILEGSVQKANDQVRVNVQLINALTDAHLWAETYDRKLTDIFAVESEIARTVAEMLRAKLTGTTERVLASRPTENPEAHQLYLKGRFYGSKRTAKDAQKSIEYFEQAVAIDSNYALAYAGLAESNWFLALYSYPQVNEAVPTARELALKALELDDR